MVRLLLHTLFVTLLVTALFSGMVQYPGALVAIGVLLGTLVVLLPSIQLARASVDRERSERHIDK